MVITILAVWLGFVCGAGLLMADDPGRMLDAQAAKMVKPGGPGFALAVIKDGKIIFKKGYGLAHLDYDVPITPKTVFYMGSVSKQFVAFAVALLESRGKLSFDDDIRKYIPELPYYGSVITVRHLIHHTGGIRGYLMLLSLAGQEYDLYHSASDVINHLLAKQKHLEFKPGDQYRYSNSGYLILAEIVKRVSGESFRDFAQKNILDPLGMKNSRFLDDHAEVVKNRAISYKRDKKKGFGAHISRFDLVGSGGLYSTVEDLFLWDQNFYHYKVGGESVIKTVQTPGKLNSGEELDYAFGLRLSTYKGLKTVVHTGGLYGYRAILVRFPQQRFSVIITSNDGGFNMVRAAYGAADLYLSEDIKKAAATSKKGKKAAKKAKKKKLRFVKLSRKHLENKTGAYLNYRTGQLVRIKVKDKGLEAQLENMTLLLSPVSRNRFKIVKPEQNIMVHFIRKGKDKKARFTVESRNAQTGQLMNVYAPVKAVKPSADQIKEYAGAYYNDELDVTYTIAAKEGKLTLNFWNWPEIPMKPTVKDEFYWRGDAFRFKRDAAGKITGFDYIYGKVTPISFKKVK